MLIVIPDRFLAGIPFAALIGPAGDYRVADSPTGMDVSARHYLQRRAAGERRSDTVLLAAAGSLPEARKELAALNAIYERADVLPETATGKEVVEAIGTHGIAHIASHGNADPRRPLRSGLQLGETATLNALDLALSRFPATRLVFLGARSTSAAGESRSAVGNVSTALLAAGVPSTVGVLWDVPDAAARNLSVAFHTALRAGHSPHQALRSAQLQLISKAPGDVLSWGGYVVSGSPVR
jgi:CHAT domain-containing protein